MRHRIARRRVALVVVATLLGAACAQEPLPTQDAAPPPEVAEAEPEAVSEPRAGARRPASRAAPRGPAVAPVEPAEGPRTWVDAEGPGPGAVPVAVRVPAIGVDAPLIELGLTEVRTLEVPETAHEVGWYTGAPRPGERGPAILAGHVNLDRQAGVFHALRLLEPGDLVHVDFDDGTTFTFSLYAREQHHKDLFPTERVYGNTNWSEIRLITCGGALDRGTGHHLDNVIVYGDLYDRT